MPRKAKVLSGRYGSLVILGPAEKPADRKAHGPYWNVRCDCGKEYVIRGAHIWNRGVTSCISCSSKRNSPFKKAEEVAA